MKLSVVILNYNVQYFLEQCIKSVQRATKNIDAEIIVIDNNSSDKSCELVKKNFPEVVLIENKKNLGFSKANNQAVAIAKGEYVCILNPDTAVTENTFLECLNFIVDKENIGALGTFLLDGTGNFLPESKRNLPTPSISLLKLLGFGKKYYATRVPKKSKGSQIPVLVGAFMFLKKSIYNEVGGFDEDYFMYGEDIDFSYKIEKAGYKNYYLGTTSVLHYKGESTSRDAAYLKRFYGAMEIFYNKHYSNSKILTRLVKLLVFLAKLYKGVFSVKRTKRKNNPEKAILLTENFSLLKKLSNALDIPLTSGSKSMFQDSLLSNTLFVFDVNYMPYYQIFSVMEQLKNRNNVFRICPPNSNFIIGSDQSDEKGTVIFF
ncbi:glycosyltransferase family 2 protein [Patiriisocius hiemis]|uniref:Glycosyltransferase family 2 protein n=1 Tax=Patiriisocius hiemis TaxID=3075604 RepID=A0ABU2YA99_9FLAO|nr:glycosyltransferase family 2 protein [Constantimarinum sp. W242]MDT0555111.1 glycosyltransferase family 2 protein [Constantimarinum sp. W242]